MENPFRNLNPCIYYKISKSAPRVINTDALLNLVTTPEYVADGHHGFRRSNLGFHHQVARYISRDGAL